MVVNEEVPRAEVDPLFDMSEEDEAKEEENEAEEEEVLSPEITERLMYRELVISDPFFKEASASVRRMLSYDAWKAVKDRTPKPDIGDVCLGDVLEKVEIIPGKLSPTFRMLSGKEWRYIVSRMAETMPALIPNQQATYRLVFGIHSLNGAPVASRGLLRNDGTIDDKAVITTKKLLEEKPLDVLTLLNVHYEWFRARMHLILEDGQVKNG